MSRTRDDSRRDDDDDTSPARTQAVVQKGEPTGGKESDEPGQQLLTSSAVGPLPQARKKIAKLVANKTTLYCFLLTLLLTRNLRLLDLQEDLQHPF